MAVSYGLHTTEKAERQEFIGDSDYSYLFMENESREGDIVDSKVRKSSSQDMLT